MDCVLFRPSILRVFLRVLADQSWLYLHIIACWLFAVWNESLRSSGRHLFPFFPPQAKVLQIVSIQRISIYLWLFCYICVDWIPDQSQGLDPFLMTFSFQLTPLIVDHIDTLIVWLQLQAFCCQNHFNYPKTHVYCGNNQDRSRSVVSDDYRSAVAPVGQYRGYRLESYASASLSNSA